MVPKLEEYLKKQVTARQYYATVFPDSLKRETGNNEIKVNCLFHSETKASLGINLESGKFHCFGCGKLGSTWVDFALLFSQRDVAKTLRNLYSSFIRPTIPKIVATDFHKTLLETPMALHYLQKSRFISRAIVEKYLIGFDGERFTIPIFNEYGFLVNLKRYLPKSKNSPKMLSYTSSKESRSYGKISLFPCSALLEEKNKKEIVFICEGEMDALSLLSLDIVAITSTCGANSWPSELNYLFENRVCCIAYDNDAPGKKASKLPATQLKRVASEIRNLAVPESAGKDVNDWIIHTPESRSREFWLLEYEKSNTVSYGTASNQKKILSLDEASCAEYKEAKIDFKAHISGKGRDSDRFLIPSLVQVSIDTMCGNRACPNTGLPQRSKKIQTTKYPSTVLNLVGHRTVLQDGIFKKLAGFECEACEYKIEVLENCYIEMLVLLPCIEDRTSYAQTKLSYFLGKDLIPNRSYNFNGTLTAHPDTHEVTFLVEKAVPLLEDFEKFELTEEKKNLLHAFQTDGRNPMAVEEKIQDIAEWQANHITKIRGRSDLHILFDLTWHSAKSFYFRDEDVLRGMLDCLVIGDTKTGKGTVAQKLKDLYGYGKIVSGEGASIVGLIGGLHQLHGRWVIMWGSLTQCHETAIIVDECSGLSMENWAQLSRIRSEGFAEITKINSGIAPAMTRILWMGNPRNGLPISSYANGVESIKDLVGNNEDISRFDLAITVAYDEVSTKEINSPDSQTPNDFDKYPIESFQTLLLWVWSRKKEQVKFTKKAETLILANAIKLGRKYSERIPLIQGAVARIKIAKIAVAIAARLFSTDDGTNIIVEDYHVAYATKFINDAYCKESMSFDNYSRKDTDSEENDVIVRESIRLPADTEQSYYWTVQSLESGSFVSFDSSIDWIGDALKVKTILSNLVRLRCVERTTKGSYLKTPSFTRWLRKEIRRLENAKFNSNGKGVI